MMTFIDSTGDILAVEVSGKITGADLDAVMDKLDEAMAAHDKVHVFVETRAIGGLELASLPGYFARALPLLGKLDRFGRVAVVADQAWIRAGTRLESAMLPNLSYRVYMPGERDEALAWVKGAAAQVPPGG
ncbi:MAG TPA: STAS/SEC14 domain-containing protein [Croceibacterium sp.]|nr:STAS/SEC14 domain-containing protein [Croceibacterium sp.]